MGNNRQNVEISEKLLALSAKAINFIDSHLTEPISVSDVTQEFEKSHWQFQRLFRSVVGVSIGQYLRERRLSEAVDLLREEKYRILDVAMEFDFGSQEAFSRSFKSYFGVTPQQIKKDLSIVLPQARRPLNPQKLDYFWTNIQRTPTIITLKETLLVGIPIEFKSHFIEGKDCQTKVVEHWKNFKPRATKIKSRLTPEHVGVILSNEKDLRDERLTYFSSVKVKDFSDIPEGMSSMVLSESLYACFEVRGCAEHTSNMVDYVYGIWLSTSEYERAKGYDLEIFDHRYAQGDPNSLARFLVPVKLKHSPP